MSNEQAVLNSAGLKALTGGDGVHSDDATLKRILGDYTVSVPKHLYPPVKIAANDYNKNLEPDPQTSQFTEEVRTSYSIPATSVEKIKTTSFTSRQVAADHPHHVRRQAPNGGLKGSGISPRPQMETFTPEFAPLQSASAPNWKSDADIESDAETTADPKQLYFCCTGDMTSEELISEIYRLGDQTSECMMSVITMMWEMQYRVMDGRAPRFHYKRLCAKLFGKLLTTAPFIMAGRGYAVPEYALPTMTYRKLLIMGFSGVDELSAMDVAKGMVYDDEFV